MRNSTLVVMGAILAVLGAVALSWQKISYTTRETVVDVGPLKVTADSEKDLPLSPIFGGIALAGGVIMIAVGARKP
ncbi:MAG TPA: DUF3185 domain-containing protein [Phycisphaerae bacterium]|nr:DUF3185 domain-containing protein [Phycisphaerae bacterium]